MTCAHCLYTHERTVTRCESCGRVAPGPASKQSPFAGRQRELAVLAEQLDEVVKTREARIVGLNGGPGVGLRRLISEFKRRHDNDFADLEFVRGYPTPGREGPFGTLVRNLLGVDEKQGIDQQRAAVRTHLLASSSSSLSEALWGVGLLTGLRFPEAMALDLGPLTMVELRGRAFATLSALLCRRAARRPMILLIEGLGDAPFESKELLFHLHQHLVGAPILVVVEASSTAERQVDPEILRCLDGTMQVEPLSKEATGELMVRLADRAQAPPEALLDAVHLVAHGQPGAIASAVTTLRERGVLVDGRAGWGVDLDAELLTFDFPLTPEDESRKRLAALTDDERAWVRLGALVGMIFWRRLLIPLSRVEHGTLSTISNWVEFPDPASIDSALARAVSLGILHRMSESTFPHDEELAFTRSRDHALLKGEISPDKAPALHAVVSQWLEYQLGPERETHLSLVGTHYAQAGHPKRAAFWFIHAGERALRRFANELATEAFERAAEALDGRDSLLLIEVLVPLGELYLLSGRHDRAERAFERALTYAWSLNHERKAGWVLACLGRLQRERGCLDRALGLLERALELLASAGDGPGRATVKDELGQLALQQGDAATATRLLNEALHERRELGDDRATASSLLSLSRLHRDADRPIDAEAMVRESLEIRLRVQDSAGIVTSRIELAELYGRQGNHDSGLREVNDAYALALRIGDWGQTVRALALSALFRAEEGTVAEAGPLALEAAAAAELLRDVPSRLRSLRALGLTLSESEPSAAIDLWSQAALIARQHGEWLEAGHCFRLVGAQHSRMSEVDIDAAAEYARAVYEPTEEPALLAEDSAEQIGLMITEVLDPPASHLPALDGIGDEAMVHLTAAVEAYAEATALFDFGPPSQDAIFALREMALLVEAVGDIPRSRLLERRAMRISADRRERRSAES
ncbi:MAG: tetratricopeptide repeat protein [Myxococcales bacterium]|nr:tetratricopeptide repeat protein [Myxococcales bacterium]